MPVRDLQTFNKFVSKNKVEEFDIDKTISQTIENTEKFKYRNTELTLLADHHFNDNKGGIYASYMFTGDIIPPHNHDFYEINFVVSGKCVEYIDERILILEEGDFLVMPPCVRHSPAPVGNSICVNVLIKADWLNRFEKKISTADVNSFLSRVKKQNTYFVFKAKDKEALSTAIFITEYFKNKNNHLMYHEFYSDSIGEKFLLELSECDCTETVYNALRSAVTADVFKTVLKYISDNISTITLESAANHFGYSTFHLSRIIKKHTGYSFKTYIMLQRIIAAEDYLIKTDIPISKIPMLIGLDSKEYFSRVFKKYNGVTPSQFKKTKKITNA